MTSKRRADKYLTDENWDEEEKPEEAGKFEAASMEVLKQRTFKKAKRRVGQAGENSSAFKGFSGLTSTKFASNANESTTFGLKSTSSLFQLPTKEKSPSVEVSAFLKDQQTTANTTPSLFQLPTKEGSVPLDSSKSRDIQRSSTTFSSSLFQLPTKENNVTFPESSKLQQVSSNGNSDEKSSDVPTDHDQKKVSPVKDSFISKTEEKVSTSDFNISEFNRHLSALNRSVSKWIAKHVEEDPVCDLTPIFTDYHQHYNDIEEKYGSTSSSQSETSQTTDGEEEKAVSKNESPKPDIIIPVSVARPKTPPKNPLGIGPISSSGTTSSLFKGFGTVTQDKQSASAFTGFQFGSNMVSATSNSTQRDSQVTQASSSGGDEEDYVPPKPESNVVEEKDAFYTKRCKLFYMKDTAYADRGVGHLHLKNVSDKTQLIIRADTSLGNVLLNIVINSAIPVSKQGKNNIVITCVPNPPIDPKNSDKVVPMLIRVKTSDDADELIELLNKKKKESE